eukprot:jgi/Astpho2/8266/Aster-01349
MQASRALHEAYPAESAGVEILIDFAAGLTSRPDCTVNLCSKDAAVGCLARSRHTACLADAELLRSRPDSTVCVCREPEYPAIPADLHEIGALKRSVQALQEVASSVSLALAEAQLDSKQAYYLPISDDGSPATGEGAWHPGSLHCSRAQLPGHPERAWHQNVMAELLPERGVTSAEIQGMDPKRFSRVFA